MAMTGRFDANFTSFYDAVQKAVIELKGFDAATGSVESSMNKMVDAFSGRQIMTEATIMTEAIEKIGGASKLTAAELEHVGTVAAEAAEKYRAWGGEVPANIQKYADAAAAAKTETTEWGTAMSMFGGIAGAMGLQSGIATVISFTKETLAAAEQLDKLRAQTGIGAESLQRFQAVGEAAGNSLEQISGAALKLAENVAGNKGSTVAALKELGISADAFRQLSIEEQFRTIAAAIQTVPDPMHQVELALELMGQKGVAVLPTLKSDIEGISAATKVMSEDTTTFWANAATNMTRSTQNMKTTFADWIEYMYGGWTRNERAAKSLDDSLKPIGEKTLPGISSAFMNMIPNAIPSEIDELNTKIEGNSVASRQAAIDAKAWGTTIESTAKVTFELAMQHEKQWREESDKQLKAHNQAVIDGLNETKKAQAEYFDTLDKEYLDSTDYAIKKIWEKVNAEKLAFKGSEEQRAAYNAAVDALGDAQTDAIMKKAAEAEEKKAAASEKAAAREIATIMNTSAKTQAELDKMALAANAAFNSILADANTSIAALGDVATAASVAGYNARLNPNGIASSGPTQFAGGTINPNGSGAGIPDTPEGRLAILAAQQARNPLQPINTAYLFAGMPSVYQAPTYSGPGTTSGAGFSQTVNVTQPLGTSDQIARAVSDALAQYMRAQGVRLPYGT
jgi:hypothetical protein